MRRKKQDEIQSDTGIVGSAEAEVAETSKAGASAETDPAASPEAKPRTYNDIKEQVLEVLRNTFDPEIPVNIYELGLVYDLVVELSGEVTITMTLTSPMCPVAESLPPEVEAKVAAIPGVTQVHVNLVWDPPWDPSKMSADAKLLLNIP